MDSQVREAQKNIHYDKCKRSTLDSHYSLLKKWENKMVKSARQKWLIMYKGASSLLSVEFLGGLAQASRDSILKVPKGKKELLNNTVYSKNHLQNEENKTL